MGLKYEGQRSYVEKVYNAYNQLAAQGEGDIGMTPLDSGNGQETDIGFKVDLGKVTKVMMDSPIPY